MSIFKCKMCGGTIEFEQGATVGICDSCGTKQTLPRLDDDRRANLYDRANHFRRNNEFDKAAGIYEQILNEDNTDAEAYWSLVLCQYGIEYVEDPSTHKRVPTVNRAQFTSVFDDDNYKSALQYADGNQRELYEAEAKAINDIQKGILSISQKEEPFDVFICYKETDQNGRRTQDSVLANDLYHQLTQEGFKVFFSRITLEDKLGTAYEPYIFAALNSAKVMVVLGTKPEHFNAVWVKNEWSRYLALVKKSGGQKVLIPAYRDMDPYDLPEEFSHLQAQDMSKLGFMQDLIRGIKKIVQDEGPRTVFIETVATNDNNNVAPLLKRAFFFLEDGKWEDADAYCEKVLDQDPENAQAYLGKLMAGLKVHRQDDLPNCDKPFDGNDNYKKAIRFGDNTLSTALNGYIEQIRARNENARLTGVYDKAVAAMNVARSESEFKTAADLFKTIPGFKDADALAELCFDKAEKSRFFSEKTAKRRRKIFSIVFPIVSICIVLAILIPTIFIPTLKSIRENARNESDYNTAISLIDAGRYYEAINAFEALDGYKDSSEQIAKCETAIKDSKYNSAMELYNSGKYDEAITAFQALNGYKDSAEQIAKCETVIKDQKYNSAMELYNAGKYDEAYKALNSLDYKDSAEKSTKCLFLKQKAGLTNVSVGSTIMFGIYDQDNNTSNGKEEIEWIVLAVEGNKALIISQYALDSKPFNKTIYTTSTTWENCTLRTWLNGTFYDAAFGDDHHNMIVSSMVKADSITSLGFAGNNTTDKVFLLSRTEVNKYFSSVSSRQCKATRLCYSQGAYRSDIGACHWWLRTRCGGGYYAIVLASGDFKADGTNVNNNDICVRPAMWIDLGS